MIFPGHTLRMSGMTPGPFCVNLYCAELVVIDEWLIVSCQLLDDVTRWRMPGHE